MPFRTWSNKESQMSYRKAFPRSEEHTSELQSQSNLVCRLLLEKNKYNTPTYLHVDDALEPGLTPHALLLLVSGASIPSALLAEVTFHRLAGLTVFTESPALRRP